MEDLAAFGARMDLYRRIAFPDGPPGPEQIAAVGRFLDALELDIKVFGPTEAEVQVMRSPVSDGGGSSDN